MVTYDTQLEFYAFLRTMPPVVSNNEDSQLGVSQGNVRGAHRNIISGEKMFVQSYVQLWQNEDDPEVTLVFSYDGHAILT